MRRRGLQVQNNNKPLHMQEAKDEQGRKHFYGAFTGALNERSVGFKGTVGSKEGFIPSTFISSRDQKA
jgi:G patch domain-containing protein 1